MSKYNKDVHIKVIQNWNTRLHQVGEKMDISAGCSSQHTNRETTVDILEMSLDGLLAAMKANSLHVLLQMKG